MAITLAEARLGANHMLAHLSDEHFAQLCTKLDRVHLEVKQVLHERNAPISYVYFPSNAAQWYRQTVRQSCSGRVGSLLRCRAGIDGLV